MQNPPDAAVLAMHALFRRAGQAGRHKASHPPDAATSAKQAQAAKFQAQQATAVPVGHMQVDRAQESPDEAAPVHVQGTWCWQVSVTRHAARICKAATPFGQLAK